MKLLLFSDLHADIAAARRLVALGRDVDVLVGAGDFGNLRRDVKKCLDVLRPLAQPAVFVAGNNESTEELRDACRGWEAAHVLHGSGVTIQGVPFFGLGGGVPVTPFGSWSYDFSDDEAAVLLRACPMGCVLLSHSPPKGAADVSSRGQSLGSTAVRAAIERVGPRLVVCGHVHGSSGVTAAVGTTPVVNAGPAGVVWILDRQ